MHVLSNGLSGDDIIRYGKMISILANRMIADSALRYGKAGILDEIADQKRAEQIDAGAALAQRFGVKELGNG